MDPTKLRDTFSRIASDLRSPRLLALVAALVVLAVAIPVLLSHSGTAADVASLPPVPAVTVPAGDGSATTSAVRASQHKAPSTSQVTGPVHNPFESKTSGKTSGSATTPSSEPQVASITSGSSSASASSETSESSTSRASGSAGNASGASGQTGAGAARGGTISAPASERTLTVEKTVTEPAPYANYLANFSLHQVGTTEKPRAVRGPVRFALLPSDNHAFASFLGVRTDGRTAVWLIATGVTVKGQGYCTPSPWKCSILTLTPGQKVTLEIPAGTDTEQFTLRYTGVDLVRSTASLVYVDEGGRATVVAEQAHVPALKKMTYSRYTGLLSIVLGASVPATPYGLKDASVSKTAQLFPATSATFEGFGSALEGTASTRAAQ